MNNAKIPKLAPPFKPPFECTRCEGHTRVYFEVMNLGTHTLCDAVMSCPMCSGKGYITQGDLDSYYSSIGILPFKE